MTKEEIRDYCRKVTQSSGTELVAITLELAANYLEEADGCKLPAELVEFRLAIGKARQCIGELISSLDMKYEISAQLLRIYLFMNQALLRADIRKDASELRRIAAMLNRLKAAFVAIKDMDKSGPVMQNAQQVYAGLTYSKGSLNEDIYIENTNRGYTV